MATLDQAEEVDLVVEGILVDQVLDQVVLAVVEDLVDLNDPVEVEALAEEEAQVGQAGVATSTALVILDDLVDQAGEVIQVVQTVRVVASLAVLVGVVILVDPVDDQGAVVIQVVLALTQVEIEGAYQAAPVVAEF